jgi:SNF2 family DNA or RNA helicase
VFGWEGNYNAKDKGIRIQVTSTNLKAYLEACGIGEELSREKSVPWCVMQGTQEVVRGFLSALFEGEASIENGGVELTSSSEVLIRDVQLLLLRFGVVSTLAPKRIKGIDHTYWRLRFFGCDADIFEREIGFRSARKRDLLRAKLVRSKNPNKDIVPFSLAVVEPIRSVLLKELTKKGANENRKGSGFKPFGGSFQSTLKNIRCYGRNPTYPFLQKMLTIGYTLGVDHTPEFQALKQVVDNHYFYDPVVKIERGEASVMDIEVDDPEHRYVANGIVSHNTAQSIAAMCYIWEKDPTYKVIVVCPKSAIRQWASEVDRFAEGVSTFISTGTPKQREQAIRAWSEYKGPSVLIMNYHGLVRDWDAGMTKEEVPESAPKGTVARTSLGLLDQVTSNCPKLLTIFDECTAFKTPGTKTAEVCTFLSKKSQRVWGLSATLLKNNLMEGFGIYQVIRPGTFGSKAQFLRDYCIVELQRIKGGGKIPIVKGYHNLGQFRSVIEPFFYGRNKHEVASDLPSLQTKEVICELSKQETAKYAEALTGVLETSSGTKDYEETKALTALIYLQQICNSIALVDDSYKERSAKEIGLLDLLQEELEGEKVIVYTRFEKMVTHLQKLLKSEKIESVRITGKESDKERKKAQDTFQDLNSKVKVIFITDAGSEAINLQAASAFVFFDSPWSWGTYVQLIGRMIRIGSPHQSVYAIHLVTELPGKSSKDKETIDTKVLRALRKKKGLIEQVLGESAVGALRFERGEDMIRDILTSLKEDS